MQRTRLNVLIAFLGTVFTLAVADEGHAQEAQGVKVDVSEELQTAQQVLATDQLKKALQYTEQSRDETIQEFLRVCNANGPAGDEIYRARHIHRLFRIYGLENVHIDDQRNVIGIRRGTGEGPTVVLNAHMDVVAQWPKEQPIQAFVADGRIWCPAACQFAASVQASLGFPPDNSYSHFTAQVGVLSPVHLAHAALADLI